MSKYGKLGEILNLKHLIFFSYRQCQAKSDPSIYGICYTNTECESKSGSKDGNCAAGFGVCCTFS